uniref:DUF1725 domain-containing protein n=1 Tax=Sus scrofa TaxID=9823 RepID=A0A8D1QGZ0_PIG
MHGILAPNREPPFFITWGLAGRLRKKNSPLCASVLIQGLSLCTFMFTVELFTIAKIRKQPKCPSTDDWINKMRHMYTVEYYSAIKKNEIMPFAATWMELEILTLSEVSQKEKNKYHMISLISGIQYMGQMNLSTEKKIMENRLVITKREGKGVGWIGNLG